MKAADIDVEDIENNYEEHFRDKMYELVKLVIDECDTKIVQEGHTIDDVRQHFGV